MKGNLRLVLFGRSARAVAHPAPPTPRCPTSPRGRRRSPTPGAYRVEVSIVPHHLGPYLGSLGTSYADQELPWIYASPIYVN